MMSEVIAEGGKMPTQESQLSFQKWHIEDKDRDQSDRLEIMPTHRQN